MKLTPTFFLTPLALLATSAAASPAPMAKASASSPADVVLNKRAPVIATVTENNVRYRRCAWPNDPKCEAVGQCHKGQRLTITCFRQAHTVNGNVWWGKIASNGFWIADAYLSYGGVGEACGLYD